MATPSQKTITVLGSLNTDLLTLTTRIPAPGETLPSLSFSTGPGGKGANQAVACARLSSPHSTAEPTNSSTSSSAVQVKMIGAVGDDVFGRELVKRLEGDGVDVGGVRAAEDASTGTAVVIVEQGSGENRILIHGGANSTVGVGDDHGRIFDEIFPGRMAEGDGGKLPDLVVMQCEIPLGTVVAVLNEARRTGVPVLFNPAPAPTTEGDHEAGMFKGALNGLHHLILNRDEAAALASSTATAGSSPGRNSHGNGDGDGDLAPHLQQLHITRHFHALGVRNVIITLGAEGVFWSCEGDGRSRNGQGDVNSVPAAK
ncbi:MAG: hypothetical protein Q9196_005149, partial [Gyalolechia fulgens]